MSFARVTGRDLILQGRFQCRRNTRLAEGIDFEEPFALVVAGAHVQQDGLKVNAQLSSGPLSNLAARACSIVVRSSLHWHCVRAKTAPAHVQRCMGQNMRMII